MDAVLFVQGMLRKKVAKSDLVAAHLLQGNGAGTSKEHIMNGH